MNRGTFLNIMQDDNIGGKCLYNPPCNAFEGLKIINSYLPEEVVITGADHDIIYSVFFDKIIKTDITINDVVMLRKLNWMVKDEYYLACFV